MVKVVRLLTTNLDSKHFWSLALLWILLSPALVCADNYRIVKSTDEVRGESGQKEYSCEVGAQVGGGYYLGDVYKVPFMNMQYVFGAQFRYKFDRRWAIQAKAQRQCIVYPYAPPTYDDQLPIKKVIYQNPVWHIDMLGEFNFFNFGPLSYDYRVKTFSPYLFVGVGMSILNKSAIPIKENEKNPIPKINVHGMNVAFYVPVGIGLKWRITKRWQLQVAWQHNVYFADDLEGYLPGIDFQDKSELKDLSYGVLNNSDDLNGSNILNNDVLSTLTIGIVYEFGAQKYKKYIDEPFAISARVRADVSQE